MDAIEESELAVLEANKVVKEFPRRRSTSPRSARSTGSTSRWGQTFVTMVGPSGCGKSTFLNIVSGMETPTSGSVLVTADDGSPATLGYVFQDPRLLPWRTVIDNLMYVHRDKADENRAGSIERYLDLVGLEGVRADVPRPPVGGMQQRVGIARAFSVEPDLLLMDEPFSHLDAITARSLREELQAIWQRTRKTVLFVTHDVLEAVQLSDRIIIVAYGGRNYADIPIDLPYPRLQTDRRWPASRRTSSRCSTRWRPSGRRATPRLSPEDGGGHDLDTEQASRVVFEDRLLSPRR